MSLSRSEFFFVMGLIWFLVGVLNSAFSNGNSKTLLPIPPLLESRFGQPIFLTLQEIHRSFNGKYSTDILSINGSYPGPTVKVKDRQDIKLIYSNRLQESVSMTVSGLKVLGKKIEGIKRTILSGAKWSPVISIRQPEATLWYNAHTKEKMYTQFYNGLLGMLIIEDMNTQNLHIPNHYGIDDFPIIIQDNLLNNFYYPISKLDRDHFLGGTLIMNGVQNPYIEVSRGWIRLRLLNSSNSKRYIMKISDGRSFCMIASNQGLLATPISISELSLSPGERREVLIDMVKTAKLTITVGISASFIDHIKSIFKPSVSVVSQNMLTIKATGLMSLCVEDLPTQLVKDRRNLLH
ncbi:multicopper oxidase domain-containing protein [Candidatus Hartigia pinicola]